MNAPVKAVGGRSYFCAQHIAALEPPAAELVAAAIGLTRLERGISFNVVRVREEAGEVALLHYPTLSEDPFPALLESWRVHPATALVSHRTYRESLNPPILHRTELLLEHTHPRRQQLAELTAVCEGLGLFEEPTKIGFKCHWEALIAARGYRISGFNLIPIANQIPDDTELPASPCAGAIFRHLTALTRTTLSAPVQCLIRHGLLQLQASFFDYGCGKGDDLRTLASLGYQVAGWDPYFLPHASRRSAEVVNIGFVINVIEDRNERVDALLGAYTLANKVLVVAAMTAHDDSGRGTFYSDGVLTSRNTFQKYFTQAELQQFIETVLGEDAYPAAPGVFYVFKDRSVEQQYLLARTANGSRALRARLLTPRVPRDRPIVARERSSTEELASEQRELLRALWERCLHLGRHPDADELENVELLSKHFRSLRGAIDRCLREYGSEAFQCAQQGRKADILVMLALQFFGSRKRFTQLDEGFKRTIRALFKSYAAAENDARTLLFSVQDKHLIKAKCVQASALGLGWLEAEHSLQLHTSLIERLDPVLRVYIGCASALAGDVAQYDLAKIHIESGKVTLMAYDDFLDKPLPTLLKRVKARLRDQELDVFEYGERFSPTVLYRKSRYINEEFPHYAEQLDFDEALEQLGLFDLSGHGDAGSDVYATLHAHRWAIEEFSLVRARDIPNLDDRCGRFFTYRQLMECGESWARHQMPNAPTHAESYNALFDLCSNIIDPVVDYFGAIRLTYGFASQNLTKQIGGRIDPRLDQHAACELNRKGALICSRGGAALDFLVADEDMRGVAEWIRQHLPFDRMYYYGPDRPLHVSYGPAHSREFFEMVERNGRRMPRRVRKDAPS